MSDRRQDVLAVIPSRWPAQRFPGKPLALIQGKPMVRWVWEAARAARLVTRVVVATDSQKVAKAVRAFGGEAMMTSPKCASGTDRVAEVAQKSRAGIIINVQGDEPLLSPQTIDKVVESLQQDSSAVMSTAVRPAESMKEWLDPNVVKAVVDRMNYALYFSRSPIPWGSSDRSLSPAPHWVHLGLYGFRRAFLFRFASLLPTPLEKSERLEQLRALEHGSAIRVVVASHMTCAVDRPGDVKKVERLLLKRQREMRGKTR